MKAITFALLILFVFTIANFAQEKTKTETKPVETDIVSLPAAPNSWIINIHQRVGLIGVHNLLLAINSEGKYVCGENTKVKSINQTDPKFTELSDILKPITKDIFLKAINEDLASCNDCLYSTLSFRRQLEKVNDSEIVEVSAKQTILPTTKEIAEKVWKTVSCD